MLFNLTLIFSAIFILKEKSVFFTVFAENTLPLPDEIFKMGGIPTPPSGAENGTEMAKSLIFGVLGYARVIAGVIGILFLTIIGYKMVILGENEEQLTNAKRALVYMIIAFIMISMAKDIGKLFDMGDASIIKSPQEILKRVSLFDKQVEILITFIKYILGALATLMIIRSAVRLIASGGNEEEVTKARQSLLYSAAALVLVYVGSILINNVLYKVNKTVYTGITGVHPELDPKAGITELVGITNFIVSFAGPVAVLLLIIGAIMYATSAGEEDRMERGKRLIIATLIGMVIIFGAFALVSTIISGRLDGINALNT